MTMKKYPVLKQSAIAMSVGLALTACSGDGAPGETQTPDAAMALGAAAQLQTINTENSVFVAKPTSFISANTEPDTADNTDTGATPQIGAATDEPAETPEQTNSNAEPAPPVVEPEPIPEQPEPITEAEPEPAPQPDSETETDTAAEQLPEEPEPSPVPVDQDPVPAPEPEPEPEPVPEPAPEPPPAEAGFSAIELGGQPGNAQCIDLTGIEKGFGDLARSDWDQWVPDLRYSLKEEHLSVERLADGDFALRQQFVPASNGTARVLMASNLNEHQTYRVMLSLFLEPGWDWGGEVSQGGKIAFGVGGGSVPSGGTVDPSGFTARLMWRGAQDGTAKIGVYSYAADRPKQYGEDNLFKDDAPIGEWMNIIYEIGVNSSINQSDGTMRAWIDGELVLDRQNVGWQLAGDKPVIDTLYYSSFYGGGTNAWSPDHTTHMKVKNICWAPVVDGYSGIDPDAGRILVETTVNPEPIFADDPFNGEPAPVWHLEREELLVQVEKSRELVQQVAPLASSSAQFYYAESVTTLSGLLSLFEKVSGSEISDNPIPALQQVLTNLDAAKALSTVLPDEILEVEAIQQQLQSAIINSADLAIAVAQTVYEQNDCEDQVTQNCVESGLKIADAQSYREQMDGADLATMVVLADIAWDVSVEAVSLANNDQ